VPEHGLGAAHAGIDVGGVEQGDAEVDRLVDHLARGFQIGALAKIVAAEADGGNAQAGAAEVANLHGSILWESSREGAHCGPRHFARKQRATAGCAWQPCGTKRCGPGQTRRLTGAAWGA
jgi:hypothetical protein